MNPPTTPRPPSPPGRHAALRRLEPLRALAFEAPLSARVVGSCMAPLLTDGMRIEVRARRVYFPGDLIAFAAGDGLFVHRFLGYAWKGRLLLLSQADNASRRDAVIDADRVLGRVCGGEAPPRAIAVPLADRLRASALWVKWCASRLLAGGDR
ncbi:MAG: S24/S26 family peptidase [Holophagales bacterium]|nr:MAG: S24/S26 family peptidase [Holophagales bacterium]